MATYKIGQNVFLRDFFIDYNALYAALHRNRAQAQPDASTEMLSNPLRAQVTVHTSDDIATVIEILPDIDGNAGGARYQIVYLDGEIITVPETKLISAEEKIRKHLTL